MKQPGFNGKCPAGFFLSWLTSTCCQVVSESRTLRETWPLKGWWFHNVLMVSNFLFTLNCGKYGVKHTHDFRSGWLLTTTTLTMGSFMVHVKSFRFWCLLVSLLFLLSLISPSLDIQTAAEKVFGPLNIPRTPYLRKYLNVSGMIFCCKKKHTTFG